MMQSGLASFFGSEQGPASFDLNTCERCRREGGFFAACEEPPGVRKRQDPRGLHKKGLIETLIFILARSFGFLATLYARALVIFLLAQIGQHAGLRAAAFESLQRIVQRLVLLHVNFRH